MNEMVERVTDVLISEGCGDGDQCERTAKLVLAAMRDPTPKMIRSAARASSNFIDEVWRTMIDAALEDDHA